MATPREEIFLAREGKIFGPFDAKELERFEASGEIRDYAFRWDPQSESWKPLQSPPTLAPGRLRAATGESNELEAIAHDTCSSLVGGRIGNVSETGCDLFAHAEADSPALAVDAVIRVNLLDPASGRSLDVQARLKEVFRGAAGWIYRLRWISRPPLEALQS
jgi:hypothetical protein